jgi:hypothetical protein
MIRDLKLIQKIGGVFIAVMILLAGAAAATAEPTGLEPGAPLMLVSSTDSKANHCKVGKYGQDAELTLMDRRGVGTKVHLKQLRRIAATGQKWELTPSFLFTKGQYRVYEFEKTDGTVFQAAIYSWAVFDIECPDGKFKNWGLQNFKLIEVPKAMAAAGTKGIRIQLRNGQVLQVPVQKEDIISIHLE